MRTISDGSDINICWIAKAGRVQICYECFKSAKIYIHMPKKYVTISFKKLCIFKKQYYIHINTIPNTNFSFSVMWIAMHLQLLQIIIHLEALQLPVYQHGKLKIFPKFYIIVNSLVLKYAHHI